MPLLWKLLVCIALNVCDMYNYVSQKFVWLLYTGTILSIKIIKETHFGCYLETECCVNNKCKGKKKSHRPSAVRPHKAQTGNHQNSSCISERNGVSLSIDVHTGRCSICRRWSSVRLLTGSGSAWNMPEGARTWDKFQELSPRFPTLQLHRGHHPPLLTWDTFCYLPFLWCCVHRDRCCTRTSCTFVLPRRLKRFHRLDKKEACCQ